MVTICREDKLRIPFLLFLTLGIIFIGFFPCLKNGFVNWDDDTYVTQNPSLRSLSSANLKNIFSSFFSGHYQPITILSFLYDYRFFKLNPFGYHLTNLILHLLNCLLVFWLIFLLTGRTTVSWVTAFLFGLHPLQVESVAWISERKNVLYALFFLGAAIYYLYYLQRERKLKYYFLSLSLFILSLLSKSMAVTLPLVLFLMDYLLFRKSDKIMLMEKIPYFTLSLIFGVIAVFGAHSGGAIRQEGSYSLVNMLLLASYGIVFYMNKILLPLELSCLYPYYRFEYSPVYFYTLIGAIIFLVGIVISGRYTRKAIFGCGLFLVTILPSLQFIPNGAIIVADRYSYIPSVGIFFIAANLLFWVYHKKLKQFRTKSLFLFFIICTLATLSLLTWNRCKIWENSFTLWDNAVNRYHNSYIPIAYFNRALAYTAKQENNKATIDFNKALMLYYNKLRINQNHGEVYKKLLTPDNNYSQVYNFLGVKFAEINRIQEAVILFDLAIKINPLNGQAYFNLCSAYGNLGRFKEAIIAGRKSIELLPNSADAYYSLSLAYYFNKQVDLACRYNKIAMELGFKPERDPFRISQSCRSGSD